MAVTTNFINKPLNPRGNDQSPKGYNRAALYSGKALDFDGVNDKLTTPNISVQSSNVWTYSFYWNLQDASQTGYIFDARTSSVGYTLYYYANDNNLDLFQSTGGNNFSSTTFEAGQWYHIALSSNGTNVGLYVNGQFVENIAGAIQTYSSTGDLYISSSHVSSVYAEHILSNLKIFNTALTAAQVADLYNNPEKIVPTGVEDTALKLYLPMMEGAGTTCYDGSGGGNHGTINGASHVSGVGAPVSQTAVIDWNKGSNLIIRSEELENSSWVKSNLTVTSNQIESPNGNDDAEQLSEQAISGVHYVGQSIASASAGTYTFSCFLKEGTQRYGGFRAVTNGFTNRHFVLLDLSDGSVASTNTVGSGITWTYNVETLSNGWYRLSITGTHSSGNIDISIAPSDSASPTYSLGLPAYLATNKNIYAWGAQVEQASSVGPYIRTGATAQTSDVLLPQGLTTGRDITGVNLFENVRKQGALNLDGNSWAEVHDNESLDFGTGSFTLEAWAKVKFVNNGSSYNVVMTLGGNASSAGNASIAVVSGLTIAGIYNNLASGSSTLIEADWIHIVFSYDQTNATLYINGSQVDQDARTAVDITNDLVKMIGRDTTGVRYYNDQIAQPRIYNRALTAAEVLQNYNSGKSIYTNS